MNEVAYCEVEDVKNALQDKMRGSDPSVTQATAAILAQGEWLRKVTKRHWFEPEGGDDDTIVNDGSTSTSDQTTGDVTLATTPFQVDGETCDIPSSPHAQPGQITSHEPREYPNPTRGNHSRVRLDRRDVSTLDALLVRSGDEFEDWIADDSREEGRAKDYYLDVDPHTGRSAVWINTRTIAPARSYDGAVVATYQYGQEGIPSTIRRAVALRAGAELYAPQDSNVQVPDEGNLTNPKSKADELRQDARRLLKPYEATAVA